MPALLDSPALASPPLHRVLIVDDDPDMRCLLRVRLEREPDMRIVGEAADGREAIEMARELSPEMVVIDQEMPGMAGDTAIPLIRSASPSAVIVMHSGAERPVFAAGSSPDRFVVKATPLDGLVAQLRSVLITRAALG